jgi:hypothetical protein
LGSKSPLQAMKDWHKLKPQLFRKQPYYLPGCDIYTRKIVVQRMPYSRLVACIPIKPFER